MLVLPKVSHPVLSHAARGENFVNTEPFLVSEVPLYRHGPAPRTNTYLLR